MENLQFAIENNNTNKLRFCYTLGNKKRFSEIFRLLNVVDQNECAEDNRKIIEEVLQIFSSISTNTSHDDSGLVECIIWLTHLQERKNFLLLNELQFDVLFQWIVQRKIPFEADKSCIILIAIERLFTTHPDNRNKYFVRVVKYILKYISQTSTDLLINLIQCLENIICGLRDIKLPDEQIEVCNEAGRSILNIFYGKCKINIEKKNILHLVLGSQQILNRIIILNPEFAKINVAELFGLAKTYIRFGLNAENSLLTLPQKVCVSQQALYDSAEEIEVFINSEKARHRGGKTPKTRKPRIVKETRNNDYGNGINLNENVIERDLHFDIKVGDSDVSDSENATNRVSFDKNRAAKTRLTAINLICNIVRLLERRIIFGYWHALFPNGTGKAAL